jgi:hypothetical protein
MQEQMTMPFDQSGQNRRTFQFNRDSSGRQFHSSRRTSLLYERTMHDNHPAFMHLLPVKYPIGT